MHCWAIRIFNSFLLCSYLLPSVSIFNNCSYSEFSSYTIDEMEPHFASIASAMDHVSAVVGFSCCCAAPCGWTWSYSVSALHFLWWLNMDVLLAPIKVSMAHSSRCRQNLGFIQCKASRSLISFL